MTLDSVANLSSAAEEYRALRTSMLLLAEDKHSIPKAVLITSSRPEEGKTTTVINMAFSLAQLGRPVLIIDCDLRKPSTHKLLGVSNEKGLSTYLTSDVSITHIIQDLPIPNLSLISSGPVPFNPSELISSKKMNDLLETLAEHYDFIVIDSPPIMNVADPVILSTLVDGVLLVVRDSKTPREIASYARYELTNVGANILGVVLNDSNTRHAGGYPLRHEFR